MSASMLWRGHSRRLLRVLLEICRLLQGLRIMATGGVVTVRSYLVTQAVLTVDCSQRVAVTYAARRSSSCVLAPETQQHMEWPS